MPWPLYLAFKQIFPTGRKFTLQTLFYTFSILGVAMGVFLLVVSQSIMSGFGRMWQDKIVMTGGDLSIYSGDFNDPLIRDPKKVAAVIRQQPGVKGVTAFAGGKGLLQRGNLPSYPDILALDAATASEVIPLKTFLIEGTLDGNLHDQAVILSTGLAQKLGAHLGDKVRFTSPTIIQKVNNGEMPVPRELEVTGIFSTGFPDLDRETMIISLELMQDFYELGGAAHGLSVRLADRDSYLALQKNLKKVLGDRLDVLTWKEKENNLLFVLGMERTMILLLTIPIYIVSGFVIICTQLVVVFSKTREIGLLGALGARPSQLALGYCLQGGAIGLLGAVVGLGGSLSFLAGKDSIVRFIAGLSGNKDILTDFYSFYDLPVHFEPMNIFLMMVSAVTLSTLASVIPAIAAALKKPAEALRSE